MEDKMATTHTTTANLTVKITPNDNGNPPGKLADAELHFGDGVLAGLKLIGFSIWERRGSTRSTTSGGASLCSRRSWTRRLRTPFGRRFWKA
jgi:hypothetical protein